MFEALKKYGVFHGRADRKEFWLFLVFNMLALGAALVFDAFLLGGGPTIRILTMLALIPPGLAVAVRRIHDVGQTGWWLLVGVIPGGALVLLAFYLIKGNPGPNKYGPPPRLVETGGALATERTI